MINLILFGPPGSGKGTQAKKLVKKYSFVHISTGDLFRHEIGNKTPLGIKAQSYMDKGGLVPDEVTIGMLRNKVEMHPNAKGFIFDGFPRTIPQAEALDELMAEKGSQIDLLVALDVPEDEIVRRILERGKTSGRPDDNDEAIIKKRFNIYKEETAQVFDFYAKQEKSNTISGVGSLLAIFRRLTKKISALLQPA